MKTLVQTEEELTKLEGVKEQAELLEKKDWFLANITIGEIIKSKRLRRRYFRLFN